MVVWKPVEVQLNVPLEGPYRQVLPRPAPEVEALGQGRCIALFRTARVMQPVPLMPTKRACYYSRGGHPSGRGYRAEDFSDPQVPTGDMRILQYLAVPAYHIRLAADAPVAKVAAQLTPWTASTIERWQGRLARAVWVTLLRVYRFEALPVPALGSNPLNRAVEPLLVQKIEPVLEGEVFEKRLQSALELVGGHLGDEEKTNTQTKRAQSIKPQAVAPLKTKDPDLTAPYPLQNWAADSFYPPERLQEWGRFVRRKKMLVFYGPPGTGKTFNAQCLARHLAGGGGVERTVQFHPTYAYEDFVQGIRPLAAGGYRLSEGLFLRFCRLAEACAPHPAVLVVDEINRADTVRVFGELLYALEYRRQGVDLAGGGTLHIPENLVLVATMNTADRSIAALDRALRRRGAFIRLQPEYAVLQAYMRLYGLEPRPLVDTLKQLNQAIDEADGLVGHSFFMQDGARLKAAIGDIWRGEIEPLVEEVLFDRPQQVQEFRWDALKGGPLGTWATAP